MKPSKINITELAREAGVSVATISRVVNGRAGVSEELRSRIGDLLKTRNYVNDSHLSPRRRIAIVYNEPEFYRSIDELAAGIYTYAEANRMEAVFCFRKHSPFTMLEQIREHQCSGAIVIAGVDVTEVKTLADAKIPVVCIFENPHIPGCGFFGSDGYRGGVLAVEHLIGLGHRQIGYIECAVPTTDHANRVKGYFDTLHQYGIVPPVSWHIRAMAGPGIERTACEAAVALLTRHPELTAIAVSNDEMALGAVCGAVRCRRRVPEDLSVVGFNNSPATEFFNPPLTTVAQPLKEMGACAMRELDLYFKSSEKHPLAVLQFEPNLIIRGTTSLKK